MARASLIASGMTPRSSRSRIRSAALIATSVPVPRASPRSAAASAGPSLTPSPAMATRRPRACRSLITATLPVGQRAGDHLIGAGLGRDRLGDGLAVPGQQHRAQAQPAQRGDRRGGGGLDRVGDRDRAAGLAVPAGQHHRAARALPRRALPGQVRRDRDPAVAEQLVPPGDHLLAVDHPARAQARQRHEAVSARQVAQLGAGGGADRRGDRVPGGVLDPAQAAQQHLAAGPRPRAAPRSPPSSPVVSVPVLSSTTVSTDREASSAW